MTEGERKILQTLADRPNGAGPDGPILQRDEAVDMMRKGWIEAVKQRPPYMSYMMITPAGRAALAGAK